MKSFTDRVIPQATIFVGLLILGFFLTRGCFKDIIHHQKSYDGMVVRKFRGSRGPLYITIKDGDGELYKFSVFSKFYDSVLEGDSVSKNADSYYISFFQSQNGAYVFRDSLEFYHL